MLSVHSHLNSFLLVFDITCGSFDGVVKLLSGFRFGPLAFLWFGTSFFLFDVFLFAFLPHFKMLFYNKFCRVYFATLNRCVLNLPYVNKS